MALSRDIYKRQDEIESSPPFRPSSALQAKRTAWLNESEKDASEVVKEVFALFDKKARYSFFVIGSL